MLRILANPVRFCDGVTRREWLRVGGLGFLGLSWPALLRLRSARAADAGAGFGRAKSVILLFTGGGQSQLETWDMKPAAPDGIRGAFQPIRTSVPGIAICEHMPRLARLAHLYTIVRSVSHDDLDHGSAAYLALTGQLHPLKSSNPPPKPTDPPTYGSILTRLRPATAAPYTAVNINGPLLVPDLPGPGQDAGLLGREYDPLLIEDDLDARPFAVADLDLPAGVSRARLEGRRTLLADIERCMPRLAESASLRDKDSVYRRAFAMLAAPECRSAFDLGREPAALRARYGRHRSGQACLLARRLVEAGVPLVTLFWNHGIRGQDKFPDRTCSPRSS